MRREPEGWSGRQVADKIGMPISTVGQELLRRGLGVLHAAIAGVSESERKEDATAFLRRVVAILVAQGVRIAQLTTDNGSAYRSKLFRRTLKELGIQHVYTRPHTPKTNGKVERSIRTLAQEWAFRRAYPNSERRKAAMRPWLRYYNCYHRHTGIQRRSPFQQLLTLRVTNVLGAHN